MTVLAELVGIKMKISFIANKLENVFGNKLHLITLTDGFGPGFSGLETGGGLTTFVSGTVQLCPPALFP